MSSNITTSSGFIPSSSNSTTSDFVSVKDYTKLLSSNSITNSTNWLPDTIEIKEKNFKIVFTADEKKYPKDFIFSDLIDLFFYHNLKMSFAKKENNARMTMQNAD